MAAPNDATLARPLEEQEGPRVVLPAPASQAEDQQEPPVAAPASGLQTGDQEEPRIVLPRPVPAEPPTPHLALAVVLRIPSGFGFDLCFYPLERLKLGVELSSVLFVSEVGVYARYAIVHQGVNDLDLGIRLQGLDSLLGNEDQPTDHEQAALELAYEHRFGANLLGIDLEVGVRRDGVWFPHDPSAVTGGLRFGHFW